MTQGARRDRAPVGRLTANREVLVTIALAIVLTGCSQPLPEADSAAAKLYVARCGTCHVAHAPHALGPAMWQFQVDRMDQKFRAARLPVPAGAEREQILDYLTRHAGG